MRKRVGACRAGACGPVHAVLKYRGIGLHVIDCDLRHHANKTSDGIRAVVITEGKP